MNEKLKKFYADRRNEIHVAAGVVTGIALGVAYMYLSQDEVRVNSAEVYEDNDTGEYRIRVDLSNGSTRHLKKVADPE